MKFTRVVLTTSSVGIVLHKDSASPSDPYILRSIDGLGPSEASLSIAYGAVKNREEANKQPVFLVGLNPNHAIGQTASDLRDDIYRLISAARGYEVYVQFYDGPDLVCVTKAFVRRIEPPLFDKDSRVQITLETARPYLHAPASKPIGTNFGGGLRGMRNDGTERSGFTAEVKFVAATNVWTITDLVGAEFMKFTYPFLANDILAFGTQEGERYVTLKRPGQADRSIPKALSADSTWLTLLSGDNSFTCSPTNVEWISNTYLPKYQGV